MTTTNSALFYQPFIFNAGDVYQASIWLRSASNSLLPAGCQQQLPGRGQQRGNHRDELAAVDDHRGFQNGTNAQFALVFLSDGTNWIDDASLVDATSNFLYAPPANTVSSVPATLFGMHINKFTARTNWPPLQQGLVRIWDVGLKWSEIETNTNTYIWTHFDACTNVVYTNNPNCKVLFTFGSTPQWAALNTNATDGQGVTSEQLEPRDMNDWSNFVQSVATRYKGFIQYYEIWNETDYKGFYSGAISNMVTMAQIARTVITNVDPSAKVLGPAYPLGDYRGLNSSSRREDRPRTSPLFTIIPRRNRKTASAKWPGCAIYCRAIRNGVPCPVWCTEGAPNIGTNDLQNQGIVARCYLFWWWQNIQNWNWYTWDLTNVNNTFQVPLSVNPPSETPAQAALLTLSSTGCLARR